MLKITIMDQLDPDHYVNRDQMGGLGIGSIKSQSFFAKIIGRMKHTMICVPNMVNHQVVACAKAGGNHVAVSSSLAGISRDSDVIAIPNSMVACNAECKFALQVRRAFPNAKIVFIGMFGTIYPEKFLPYSDVVVSGEPEAYFLKLKTKDDIGEGLVESERIEDLDSLPFPDWESFNLKKYSYWPILRKYPMVTMVTSKSCVYSCAYCPYPLSYGKFRKRNVDKVVEEMITLKETVGVRSIVFRDPLFTFSKPRSTELFTKMIDAKVKMQWVCETRFDHLDEDLIDLGVKAGMKGVNVGVETGNLDVLKSVKRKFITSDQQKKMVDYMRKKNVWVTGFYILGHDSDTEDTMEQTFKFSKYLNTPIAQFTINTPIPHSPEFKAIEDKLLSSNPEEYTFFNPVFKTANLSPGQIVKKLNSCLSRYYFRPGYFVKNVKYYIGPGRWL
jgi:anaerobic magnesium-protoporphyrin IX monomethyl ester cyclase